jgi:spermidine synthase
MLFRVFFCFLAVSIVNVAQPNVVPAVLFSKKSPFGLVEIVTTSEPGILNICENGDYSLTHSIIVQGDSTYLGAAYEPLATTSLCFVKDFKKILLLGLGAGEFLGYLLNYFLDVQVDAVEINPAMIEIVKKFRKIDSKNTVNFICEDAFKYVITINKNYDLIYCDVYFFKPSVAKEYKDFFEKVKKHLKDDGVFIWNAYLPFIPKIVVADMFKNFENVTAAITNEGLNVVFICYQGPEKNRESLEEIAKDMQSKYNFRYALPDQLQKFKSIVTADYDTWIAKFPELN